MVEGSLCLVIVIVPKVAVPRAPGKQMNSDRLNPPLGMSCTHPKASGNTWRFTCIQAPAGPDPGLLLSYPLCMLLLFLRCLLRTDPEVRLFSDSLKPLYTLPEVGHRDFSEDSGAIARSVHLSPRS